MILDRHHLDELRQTLGGEAFTHFLALFEPMQQQTLAELRSALDQSDAEVVTRALHTLKGGSAYVGGKAMAERCRTLEMLARADQIAIVAGELAALEAEAARLSEAILGFSSAVN